MTMKIPTAPTAVSAQDIAMLIAIRRKVRLMPAIRNYYARRFSSSQLIGSAAPHLALEDPPSDRCTAPRLDRGLPVSFAHGPSAQREHPMTKGDVGLARNRD